MDKPSKLVISQTKRFEEYRFTWKIAHFLEIRRSLVALEGQKFYFEMGSRIGLPTQWKCSLKEFIPPTSSEKVSPSSRQSSGRQDQNNNWEAKWVGVFFSLEKKPEDVKEVWIRSRLQIYNTENNAHSIIGGGVINPVPPTSLYFDRISDAQNAVEGNTQWGFGQVIPQSEPETRLPLSDDGFLVLELLVTLYNYQIRHPPANILELETVVKKFEPVFLRRNSQDLANLSSLAVSNRSKSAPIITLISEDGDRFSVHRDVLLVRGAGLKHKLLTKLPTAQEIEIHGLSSEGLRVFFNFLYTGALTDNWSNPGVIETLVWTAHEFYKGPEDEGGIDLTVFLDLTAGLVCTPENAGKLLWLARKFGMERAEKNLFQYIQRHTSDPDMFFSFAKDAIEGVKVTVTRPANKNQNLQRWTVKKIAMWIGIGIAIFTYFFLFIRLLEKMFY